tara:strand:+ start:527 stop:700 length:174 start_codon:yes stop_codon:yes gene_type:complete
MICRGERLCNLLALTFTGSFIGKENDGTDHEHHSNHLSDADDFIELKIKPNAAINTC